jgi:segregation and condensation protein A
MPEEPKKEPPARQTPELTCDGDAVPGGEGNDDVWFPYFLQIGDVYDGPLDVLLTLIKKQNLDIYDLPIAKITAQFQAYARTIPHEEVETAAEFVYMVSQLIFIKSRMLLPIERTTDGSIAEDPRRSLVERLLEYEQVKQAAQMLRDRHWAETATWTNPGAREFRAAEDSREPNLAQPADSNDLASAFRQIMERATNRPTLTVTNEVATVAQMLDYLRQRLEIEDAPISFEDALDGSTSPRIITSAFLAVLEMVRVGAVVLKQDKQCGNILVKKTPDFEARMNSAVSFDQWT